MPDKVELSTDNSAEDPKIPQNEEELERIFEERFDLFMSQLSQRVEEEKVPVAVCVLVDPKYPATPMVFKTGHIYDQAQLLVDLLRPLRQQIDKELSV